MQYRRRRRALLAGWVLSSTALLGCDVAPSATPNSEEVAEASSHDLTYMKCGTVLNRSSLSNIKIYLDSSMTASPCSPRIDWKAALASAVSDWNLSGGSQWANIGMNISIVTSSSSSNVVVKNGTLSGSGVIGNTSCPTSSSTPGTPITIDCSKFNSNSCGSEDAFRILQHEIAHTMGFHDMSSTQTGAQPIQGAPTGYTDSVTYTPFSCNQGWSGLSMKDIDVLPILFPNTAVPVLPPGYVPPPTWAYGEYGSVPAGAYPAGSQPGQNLYICRGKYNGGLQLGKIGNSFWGCNIPYGGQEITLYTYEVLTKISSPVWRDGGNGSVPSGSRALGFETGGRPALYSCRTSFSSGLHLGKIRPGFSGCNFGYAGWELTGYSYQVLGTP